MIEENKINENNQNKGKKKLFFIVLIVIIIAVIALIIVPKIIDFTQQSILLKEVVTLSNKVVGEDEYNTAIKTSGDYAKVEETIKNYMQEYSDVVKEIRNSK